MADDLHHERDRPWMMRTYSGHSSARASQRALPHQPGQGPDRPLGRLRPADPDRLRRRPPAGPRRGRQGRRPDRPHRRHGARCSTASRSSEMNTSMTINAHRGLAARALRRRRRDAGRRRPRSSAGTTQNDIIKEYLSRGTYVFPPEPRAAHRRHGRVQRRARSRSGTRSTSAPTTSRRPARRRSRRSPTRWPTPSRCSTPSASRGQVPDERFPARRRAHLLLRERRHPLRRGDLQDARDHRALGRDRAASATASTTPKLRRFRYGVQVNCLGLTEAQPENNVIRIVLEALGVTLVEEGPRPRAPAAGLERGARPAAPLGPAVVAAHPADPRLRDRPARVRGPLRRLPRDRGRARPSWSRPPAPSWTTCWHWAAPSRRSRTPT